MFIPSSFRVDDLPTLHELMSQRSFATLVTRSSSDELTATHLPLLLNPSLGQYGALEGHLARANGQWRDATGEALAVFSGPHAYISPNWYDSPRTVPTWNYVAVHAYGPLELIEDEAATLAVLRRSLEKYESAMPTPWTLERSGDVVDKLLGSIVAFRMPIARLEGKWKLNQNHPLERQTLAADALDAQGGEDNQAVAALMRENVERAKQK